LIQFNLKTKIGSWLGPHTKFRIQILIKTGCCIKNLEKSGKMRVQIFHSSQSQPTFYWQPWWQPNLNLYQPDTYVRMINIRSSNPIFSATPNMSSRVDSVFVFAIAIANVRSVFVFSENSWSLVVWYTRALFYLWMKFYPWFRYTTFRSENNIRSWSGFHSRTLWLWLFQMSLLEHHSSMYNFSSNDQWKHL